MESKTDTKLGIKPDPERGAFDDRLDGTFPEDDNSDTETLCGPERAEEIQADFQNDEEEFNETDRAFNECIDDVTKTLIFESSKYKIPLIPLPIPSPVPVKLQEQAVLKTESQPDENLRVPEQPQNVLAENEVPFIAITNEEDYFERLYKESLQRKIKDARENIQTFAKTVKYQYQPFMSVINENERKHEGFFCEFLDPRQCPIEKSFSGRWKFKLNKMVIAIGDGTGPITTATSKVTYTVGRTREGIKEEDGPETESDLPPHIQRFVKFFEEFLNLNSAVQKEASRDPGATKNQKNEFYELHLRSNYKLEVMAIVNGYKGVTNEMRDALKDWASFASHQMNIVAVFLRTLSGNKNRKFNTDHLFGGRSMMECVGRLSFSITPTTNFYSNVAGIELFYETLVELMKPFQYNSVVMIGSGLGLVPLLLANDFQDVVGIEEKKMMIQDAEIIRNTNEVHNVRFVEFEENRKVDMILDDIKKEKFFVIIDNNTNCGRSPMLLEKLQSMLSLRHVIVMSTFRMTHAKPLARLFEPIDQENGLPFYPIKGCIVDPTPTSGYYQAVVLLQRFAIKKVSNELKTEPRTSDSPVPRSPNEKRKEPESEKSVPKSPGSTSSIDDRQEKLPENNVGYLFPQSESEGSPSSNHGGRDRRHDYYSDRSREQYDRQKYSRSKSNKDRIRSDDERSYRRTDRRRREEEYSASDRESTERDDTPSLLEKSPNTLMESVNILEDCLRNLQRTVSEKGTENDQRYMEAAFDQLNSMKKCNPSGTSLGNNRKRKFNTQPERSAKRPFREDRQIRNEDEQYESSTRYFGGQKRGRVPTTFADKGVHKRGNRSSGNGRWYQNNQSNYDYSPRGSYYYQEFNQYRY